MVEVTGSRHHCHFPFLFWADHLAVALEVEAAVPLEVVAEPVVGGCVQLEEEEAGEDLVAHHQMNELAV